ncbi:MAG TPA: recombinase family protein [Pirellulales bacterium]|nr:recombinase family protein [Pirellulales bacterium]
MGFTPPDFCNSLRREHFAANAFTSQRLAQSGQTRSMPVVTGCGGWEPGQNLDKSFSNGVPHSGQLYFAGLVLAAALANRRRLRVVIYARYSTAEQDASSIDDQERFCRSHLERLGIDGEVVVLSDPEISGERLHRPGMDRLWQGIIDHTWDLLICEDSSRLFRAPTHCLELVETA